MLDATNNSGAGLGSSSESNVIPGLEANLGANLGTNPNIDALARRRRSRPHVLLASRSPRRRMLLNEHEVPHDAVHPGFEDSVLAPGEVTPEQWVVSLAHLKAWAGAQTPEARAQGGRVVVGADTACLMDGKLIGTPADAAEARAIITSFIGREHDVLTGVAVIDLRGHEGSIDTLPEERQHLLVDRASVSFGSLSEQDVDRYIESELWAGKAGAYNIAERIDAGWPITFEGDRSTIMGLPMGALLRRLDAMG